MREHDTYGICRHRRSPVGTEPQGRGPGSSAGVTCQFHLDRLHMLRIHGSAIGRWHAWVGARIEMSRRPPAMLVGNARGLDFLNTIATPIDAPIDWIDDGEGLLKWLK